MGDEMIIHPVIIIGAGPAGIATAVELIKQGYKPKDIIILEKSGQIAHMIASKYPDEKPVLANYKQMMAQCVGDMCITDMSKQDFLDYLKETVKEKELQIHFHQNVESVVHMQNGQWRIDCGQNSWLSHVVFIAIGNMSAPRSLNCPISKEALPHIFTDIQNISDKEKEVLVVGGGDSASEYAQILYERGHRVTLSYRKEKFSRMLPANMEKIQKLIKDDKVSFLPASTIESVDVQDQKLLTQFKNSSPSSFDAIITALGADRPKHYLQQIGINSELGNDGDFQENEKGGLFFIGDIASGKGGSINFAFNSATKAVEEACYYYLDCQRK